MTDKGPGAVLGAQERAQRHHLALALSWAGAHIELLENVGTGAGARVGLDVDLPGAAELVELIDVIPAHVHLESRKDILDRHLQRLDLGAVDVHEELGRVRPIQGEDSRIIGLGVGCLHQLIGHRL
jgi:hypothetical protein